MTQEGIETQKKKLTSRTEQVPFFGYFFKGLGMSAQPLCPGCKSDYASRRDKKHCVLGTQWASLILVKMVS